MTANRMKINDSKTDALLVHGKNRPHEFPLIAGDVQIVPFRVCPKARCNS